MEKERKPIPCPECGEEKYFEGLCYWCKVRKKRESYQAMTASDIEKTVENIIEKIETIGKWEDVFDDFTGLLAYHDINTEKIADAAFQKKVFDPSSLYRNASAEIQNKLIELLLQNECKEASHILCCLAACGSDKVLQAFLSLEKNPKPWRKKLYVDPSVYAGYGGWSFDENGNKIELIYQDCYAIQKTDKPNDAVKVGTIRDDFCSFCGCKMIDILTIDGKHENLTFLGLNGKVRIPVCPSCATLCEKIIIRYTLDGDSTSEIIEPFGDENYMIEENFKEIASNKLSLIPVKQLIYYACSFEDTTTIGGHADWVQDWVYEDCPDCGKKMKLLSAVSWDNLIYSAEGTLYLEICTDCSVITAFHQQT